MKKVELITESQMGLGELDTISFGVSTMYKILLETNINETQTNFDRTTPVERIKQRFSG